jgi:hypothetical protein
MGGFEVLECSARDLLLMTPAAGRYIANKFGAPYDEKVHSRR